MVIRTVSDLVEALGGSVKVSGILHVSSPQVSNMRAENRIPPKHYLAMKAACEAAKVDCPERFFFDRHAETADPPTRRAS